MSWILNWPVKSEGYTKMKTVQVLLSTYNGETYLKEQIDSLINQKDVNVKIAVRDDGSTDNTLGILEEYRKNGQLEYFAEENVGYRKSFLTLSSYCIGKADYYAFCDQDDVWYPEKLIEAVKKLEAIQDNEYKLYFSNLIITDQDLNRIGYKDYKNMEVSLGCAMTRYNISGCTMVFNDELLKLITRKACIEANFGGHDAWIYKICLSVSGAVVFDPNSYICYRQHGKNVTGVRQGISKRFSQELKAFTTNKNYKSKCAEIIHQEYFELISTENKILLGEIATYRNSILKTLRLMFNRDLKFGAPVINVLNKLKILLRCY